MNPKAEIDLERLAVLFENEKERQRVRIFEHVRARIGKILSCTCEKKGIGLKLSGHKVIVAWEVLEGDYPISDVLRAAIGQINHEIKLPVIARERNLRIQKAREREAATS